MGKFYGFLIISAAAFLISSCQLMFNPDFVNKVEAGITTNQPYVYIAGQDGSGNACYWANGSYHQLTTGGTGKATSIFVSGSTAYISGVDGNNKACYWVDGVEQSLENGANGKAASIFVLNSIIYIAGVDASLNACYWVNGVEKSLGNGLNGQAFSIFVSGGNVYVAGNDGSAYPQNVSISLETVFCTSHHIGQLT
ncbi:MAG: hypothetical protein ABSG94_02815 [Brevinematales bacterium]